MSRSGKKQAKNPFYFFMQAKKKQWIAEGGHSLKRIISSNTLLIRSPCRYLGREKTDEQACGSLSPYLGSEQDQSHFPGSLHGGGEAVAVRTTQRLGANLRFSRWALTANPPTSRTSVNPILKSRPAVGRHSAGGGPGAAGKARYGDRDRADGAGGRQEAHSAGVSFGTLQLS